MTGEDQSQGPAWERFRLQTQEGERAGEGHHLEDGNPYTSRQQVKEDDADSKGAGSKGAGSKGKKRLPSPRSWGLMARLAPSRAEFALIIVIAVVLVAAAVFSVRSSGFTKTGVFALVALAPLTLVTVVLLHADRLAPLRFRYLVYAFLWGAGVATMLASVVNSSLYSDLLAYLGQVDRAETLVAVVVAPVAEESFKGVGVVLVLLLARRHLVSTKNGVVTGGLVGAGFAFTENIIYFVQAHAEGSAVLGVTIFARGVMSPFIHPMATSFTGLAVAAALLSAARVWGWVWRVTAGLAAAIAMHALWNGFAMLGSWWIVLYLAVEVPLLVAWLVWLLRGTKKRLEQIGVGLGPYVETGWVSVEEQRMVSNPVGRRYALKWAKKVGAKGPVRKHMRAAGRLALAQNNMEKVGPRPEQQVVASTWVDGIRGAREDYLLVGSVHAQTGEKGRSKLSLRKRKKSK